MGKNKGSRIVITLQCDCKNKPLTDQRKKGIARYTSCKNRRNTPNRLEIKKFCKYCNKHEIFKEIK
uniref:Large ribosomal subunit protein bL33c n=1 Tax=Tolypiocladia glomerulata TaxID=860646 RepID=A0A1Z1MUI2_9FLOR|nr:ribosomal protein L33 [Tolypiocladia glomerulata]ARW69743.1 ribosomal protein L33 [Tolypiocladia glomerulata]